MGDNGKPIFLNNSPKFCPLTGSCCDDDDVIGCNCVDMNEAFSGTEVVIDVDFEIRFTNVTCTPPPQIEILSWLGCTDSLPSDYSRHVKIYNSYCNYYYLITSQIVCIDEVLQVSCSHFLKSGTKETSTTTTPIIFTDNIVNFGEEYTTDVEVKRADYGCSIWHEGAQVPVGTTIPNAARLTINHI